MNAGAPLSGEAGAVAFLLAAQDAGGGWGYGPASTPCVEPTAAALLALRDVAVAAASRDNAAAWLRKLQRGDGGWGMSAEDAESGWHTAWALLALAGAGGDHAAAITRGRDWLTGVTVVTSSSPEMQTELQATFAIDFNLRGLPWLPDQASWVEPTALGILALARAPSSDASAARRVEATQFLVDRRCRAGGWNFGNPVMLGAALPPRGHPTALALLALAQVARDRIAAADLATLREQMRLDGGALALGSGLLALTALGEDDATARRALAAQQAPDGSWNANPLHTALALLAGRGTL